MSRRVHFIFIDGKKSTKMETKKDVFIITISYSHTLISAVMAAVRKWMFPYQGLIDMKESRHARLFYTPNHFMLMMPCIGSTNN